MPLRYVIFIFASIYVAILQGQDQMSENGTNYNVLYRNDMSGKLYANTRGFGLAFRQSKHITAKMRSYYELDLQTLQHPKEVGSNGEAESRRRYIYGKMNSVIMLRAALGLQNVLFSKGDIKAVEVRYSYSIGPTLAMAKPYYVKVYKTGTIQQSIKYDSENYNQDRIIGRAAYTEGLSEAVFYPAITGRFNLSFEYAPYTNLIRAIETGVSLDFFPKALPMMTKNPAENFIITFNIGFVFGRKWF